MGKKRKIKKSIKITFLITGIILAVYLVGSLYFTNHYYFNTIVNGTPLGLKTELQVKEYIKEKTREYSLVIQGREGIFDRITAESIELDNIFDDSLKNILQEQNGFLWISSIWKTREYEIDELIVYNKEKVENLLKQSILLKNERKAKNAYIGEFMEDTKQYPLIEEDKGTTLLFNRFREVVENGIDSFERTIVLEDLGCYVEPEITSEDKNLVKVWNTLNLYTGASITYDWNGVEEVVDGDQIKDWLIIEQDNVQIDKEAVREKINALSRAYDTFGKKRVFKTSLGEEVDLISGAYGWRVDRSAETQELIQFIKKGEVIEREPVYLFTAYVKGQDDIGKSYVEIDLGKQHLYLYVDGEMILESDFVSGNIARGYATPPGIFGLTYKERNATLRGETYASNVSYWMPFNGNIGMHDAGWRKEFGGDIYLKNGSHGCVNLPKENAEIIYGYLEKNFPIICY